MFNNVIPWHQLVMLPWCSVDFSAILFRYPVPSRSMSSTLKPNESMAITAYARRCTQLLDVHVALLTVILQHVPLQDRLGVCTLVCRSFHAAAVAATNSISTTSLSSQPQFDQLSEWLQRHVNGITSFDARRQGCCEPKPSLASLPCPLLRDLHLYGLSLQPGFFGTCTGLTRLLLKTFCVEGSPHATSGAATNPLTQLSVLSSLQHLGLVVVLLKHTSTSPKGAVLDFPSSLLSQLVQLTYLQLGHCRMQSNAALQHLSALSALQHLDLDLWGLQDFTGAALTGLQHLQQLTALRLHFVPWAINLHSMPAVTVLTALRVLQLWSSNSIAPAVLAGFSQLQELILACGDPWDAEGSAALLAAIRQQPQLQRLQLCLQHTWCPPSAAAYSALTASSHLQHLELQNCEFPACAWQQMFPPTRCLPELRHLGLKAYDDLPQQLSPADLQAMVSCCPALGTLKLGPQMAVATAAPLQQLTGLADLSMSTSFQDNAPSIAQLTGLQQLTLNLHQGDRVTISGLLQLTMLQQLRYFGIGGAACDPGLASSGGYP